MATLCEWFGLKTTQTVFTGLASKLAVTVFGGLASKPAVTVSGSLASKPAVTVSSGLASKLVATIFSSLASKLVATVSPGLGLKIGSFGLVIWVSKSLRRFLGLGLKTKWASVCQLRHKIDRGRSVQDTR
jgi:hypothetical protein